MGVYSGLYPGVYRKSAELETDTEAQEAGKEALMTIIWWTLYILGALTIGVVWIYLMGFIGYLFKVIKNKEWAKVKTSQGPSGNFVLAKDLRNLVQSTVEANITNRGILSRKDIESLIRMEVAAYLAKLEISHTTYPGLGKEELKFKTKEDK